MIDSDRTTLTMDFCKEGEQWSGLCRESGTASCGDTLPETIESLGALVALHLDTLEELGERVAWFDSD